MHYDTEAQLQRLNDELFLAKNLAIALRERRSVTIQDEIAAKFDVIIERVQNIIDMHPEGMHFEVRLFSSAKDAQNALYEKYKRKVNYISFYSRKDNLVYLSVADGILNVVAHEFGHVIVEHYFERSPPVKMHEVMAQYAEKHIGD